MVNKPVTVICYHFQVLCTIHIVHAILSCDWVCSWFIYTSITTSTWVMHCTVTLQWLWHHIGNRKFSAPYYNFMGPSSCMQTIIDQSIVKQHVTLLATKQADICIENYNYCENIECYYAHPIQNYRSNQTRCKILFLIVLKSCTYTKCYDF